MFEISSGINNGFDEFSINNRNVSVYLSVKETF